MELQAALEVVASDKYWFQASLAGSRRDGILQEFMHAEYRALFFSGVQDDLRRSPTHEDCEATERRFHVSRF